MHGRPQVQQPLRLGAYAMRLDVDAAVIELELKTPADSLLDKVKDTGLRRPLTTTERTVVYFTVQSCTQRKPS
ncbi:hypothetical protein LA080_008576 [Diaporthe eres]|nr:hypothetical protein LA080_008576 [Diaporthe eres]